MDSLLDALAGARLIIIDEEERVAYAWFGDSDVSVFDETGGEITFFRLGAASKLTGRTVRMAIDRMRAGEVA